MKRKTGAQKLRDLVEAVPEEGMPMAEAMRRTGLQRGSIETYMYHNLKLPLRLEAGRLYRIAADELPTTTSEGSGPCAEERAIGERLGLEWTEEIHGDLHWWADPANGAARVWFVNGAWTQRDGGSFLTSLAAMKAYEATRSPPVSVAEDRQVAALGAAAVWELVAARREIERLEREAKENDWTIASSHHAFSTLHRLCDEAHVPNHNGELVARVRELAERVGPCRDDEVMRLEESLIRLLERACPGAAWAGREAAEAAITQALDAERLEAGCGDSTSDRAQVAALGAASADLAGLIDDLAETRADLKAADAQVVAAHRACDEAGVRDGDLDWRVQTLAAQARHDRLAVSQPPPGWQWTGTAWARTNDQPAPSGGVGDVWGEIIALLPEGSRARALAVERRQVGIDRYGVPLGRGDGRDEARDEREELLDAAAFRQRRIGHPGKLARGVAELLATAVDSDVWWDAYYEWTARSTWTDREADAWRAVMRAVDPTVGAVIAALSGVTP